MPNLPPPPPSPKNPADALRAVTDLRLALGVLREPYAWKILFLGFLGAVAVMAALGGGLWWVAARSGWIDWGWIGKYAWTQWLFGGLGTVVYLVAAYFLFPVILTAVAGIFLEDLADRIERRHYPDIHPPRLVPLSEQIRSSIRGLVRGLLWNLCACPLYLIPVVNVIAYALVNARLLSREYFQVVALRHLSMEDSKRCYRQNLGQLWREGLVLTGLFLIPVVQVIAPLLATALSVHRLWRRENAILRRAVMGRET